VPRDRDPREIEHTCLADEDDMWIHLFNALLTPEDRGLVVYYGARDLRKVEYTKQLSIWMCPTLEGVGGDFDFIFARGGFPEYNVPLQKLNGYKIYYGAGKRFIPVGETVYNLILVDSFEQLDILRDMCLPAELLLKPAAPLFRPHPSVKEFDVCYAPNNSNHPHKACSWLYATVPDDLKVLHLGHYFDGRTPPKNVTVRRVSRWEMPAQMSSCKVGAVPYGRSDSGPRVIPEMMACGLPVVCCDETHFSPLLPPQYTPSLDCFWGMVYVALMEHEHEGIIAHRMYNELATINHAARDLRKKIQIRS
jgi:hypothetical protein